MAVDKSILQAPQGMMDEDLPEGAALEIEIVDPEEVTLSDGSVEITLIPEDEIENKFEDNLAEKLDEDVLSRISYTIMESVQGDIDSRKEWADTYVEGLDVLGFKYEERTEPWEGAWCVLNCACRSRYKIPSRSHGRDIPCRGACKN